MSTRRVLSLALLASGSLVGRSIAYNIINKSYFDNDSSPIYPSPNGTGTGLWIDSYVKAKSMVAHMTTEGKSNLTTGAMTTGNGCSGIIPAIQRLGFPGMCFQDSGNGVRGVEFSSSFPSGIHVGASWNKTLAYQRASAMAGEFRALGVNVALGPVVGPLGRVAQGGRNWEVHGIQAQGVIASTKHFIGYEQETNRNPVTSMPGQKIEQVDLIWMQIFSNALLDAVHAGTGSIMCSYNQINNTYGCQNSKTLNGLLKTELGFNGFVVSDWDAQNSGLASALSGLDVAMAISGYEVFWGPNLTTAVNNNSMPVSRLDDMATR
ncbi:hypothetical protein BOTNAR_2506g00010 [Botryotinia narcissicola]|uniref:beta-glucosidase n=1 Tax=Botryotinia narcissicola TaxID=278944 RepID=A0A4Z1H2Z9_9HELO|nr:hypothetical protein BOTNAR_2506g00010 [Botryotinia narcissicola]